MITCTCGHEILKGKICPSCARIFCDECLVETGCPFCKASLTEIDIENQEFQGKIVQWISDGTGWKIGVTGFSELPRNILYISKTVAREPHVKFVISPNKRTSEQFNVALCKTIGCRRPDYIRTPAEESRYSVVVSPETHMAFILLNAGAIPDASVMRFLTLVISETTVTLPNIRAKIEKPVLEMLRNTLQGYVKNFGIEFLVVDQGLKDMANLR
jgi:hypothetical protein